MRLSLAFTLCVVSGHMIFSQTLKEIYNAGINAFSEGDHIGFLKSMQQADSLSPMHPTITYGLARAQMVNGLERESLKSLVRVAYMSTGPDPETDSLFSGVDMTSVLGLRARLNEEVSSGVEAFTNKELDLHPESVAYDPGTGCFFLNSVRKGKIVKYDPKTGEYSDFSTGLWAVMGMKVYDGYLCACEVATAEHQDFDEVNRGKMALLKIRLNTGTVVGRWELSDGHWFGDLIFSKDGTPYVSDSMAPMIYTLENDQLMVYQDFRGKLFNLQGLAFNDDETHLFIADYKIGIQVFDLSTSDVHPLHRENAMTKGTDGLYFYKNSLIAIKNGVRPFRVSRFYLVSSQA